MADAETLAVYDAKIDDYKKLTFGSTPKSLLRFIDGLPDGAHALDLGCGPGFAAADMARRGVQVTAMDASPEMVKAASGHPGVTALLGTYDDLPSVPTYHGVYANFALLHSNRADFIRQISEIHASLHPRGLLHLGLKLGTGEKQTHWDGSTHIIPKKNWKTSWNQQALRSSTKHLAKNQAWRDPSNPLS